MVEAVAVVAEGGGADLFFGTEALGVGGHEGDGLGLEAAEGVVFVLGPDGRGCAVADEHGDVARAVGVVIVVGGPCTGGGIVHGGTRQESADAPCSARRTRKVQAPHVVLGGDFFIGPFLDDRHAVINIPRLRHWCPCRSHEIELDHIRFLATTFKILYGQRAYDLDLFTGRIHSRTHICTILVYSL